MVSVKSNFLIVFLIKCQNFGIGSEFANVFCLNRRKKTNKLRKSIFFLSVPVFENSLCLVSAQNGLQLHGNAHIAFDFEFAKHHGLHRIEVS
jgi:hypothetical protein